MGLAVPFQKARKEKGQLKVLSLGRLIPVKASPEKSGNEVTEPLQL